MTADAPLLCLRGLSRSFGQHEVVRDLELTLRRGERAALWGSNGAGKSTVLRCVAGSLAPTAGQVLVGGHPAGSLRARQLIGASLAQERSFYQRLTGRQNLTLYARLRGLPRKAAARHVGALEEELALAPVTKQRVDQCSSGMVQQLAFARALLGDPAVVLLDEPTRSLDVAATERLWEAIDRRPGVALLMATHLEVDVAHCGERVQLDGR